jgi:hypothetical protein
MDDSARGRSVSAVRPPPPAFLGWVRVALAAPAGPAGAGTSGAARTMRSTGDTRNRKLARGLVTKPDVFSRNVPNPPHVASMPGGENARVGYVRYETAARQTGCRRASAAGCARICYSRRSNASIRPAVGNTQRPDQPPSGDTIEEEGSAPGGLSWFERASFAASARGGASGGDVAEDAGRGAHDSGAARAYRRFFGGPPRRAPVPCSIRGKECPQCSTVAPLRRGRPIPLPSP